MPGTLTVREVVDPERHAQLGDLYLRMLDGIHARERREAEARLALSESQGRQLPDGGLTPAQAVTGRGRRASEGGHVRAGYRSMPVARRSEGTSK